MVLHVTWGGTESMEEAGVCEAIRQGDYEFIDRKKAKTPEEIPCTVWSDSLCGLFFNQFQLLLQKMEF